MGVCDLGAFGTWGIWTIGFLTIGIWEHQALGLLMAHLWPTYGPLMAPFDPFWPLLVPFGPLWTLLAPF